MASVSNLKINLQSGSGGTYYASWDFNAQSKGSSASTSSSVRAGDLVTIKSGATYYNGVSIPSWVMNDRWYVVQVSGDRAVLGRNVSGTQNIQSPINTKYLSGGSGSSSSSSSSASSDTVDHYEVEWFYDTGNSVWFSGGESTTNRKNATYSAPSNAIRIKVTVKPVSKTYKSNNKDVYYWTGTSSSATYSLSSDPPEELMTPSVVIEDYTLTATLDNISDSKTDKVLFQVYDGNELYKSGTVKVVARRAVYSCKVDAGGNYRVRCRAVNDNGTSSVNGDWSNFTGESSTIPKSVSKITVVAESSDSVKVSWSSVGTATNYEVQWTVNESYFDSSSEVNSTTVTNSTAYINGLEAREWFFRVRASNSNGSSAWSNVASIVVGAKPQPPTTWSLTTKVVVGEEIVLYWVHNTEDGSKQLEAVIEFTINSSTSTVTVPGSTDEEDDEDARICSYKFSSKGYSEGATILWKVKTKGITGEYSDWSTQRTINLYAPPTLSLTLSTNEEEALESFPLVVTAKAGPNTQTPISYHISVIADNSYETEDVIGSSIYISAGSEVYSKIFNVSDSTLIANLSAGDMRLENDQSYTVNVLVSMDSGLTATETASFSVDWEDSERFPDASVNVDTETLSAYIIPFCVDVNGAMSENVTLSIYRREYDGSFTEIASGLKNDNTVTVTDPHPALDYARYRIVAMDVNTGSVSYEDLPGMPVNEPSIVIQWDETWTNYDYTGEVNEIDSPTWAGSMLRLPYNVDINEKYDSDVSLIEYIGRKNPVSYYGTQRGESASWSCEIVKSDKETLYALRRLAVWMGDVYVREPSGTGYWAHVKVSMPVKHLDLTIPVSFEITRVEGGV